MSSTSMPWRGVLGLVVGTIVLGLLSFAYGISSLVLAISVRESTAPREAMK